MRHPVIHCLAGLGNERGALAKLAIATGINRAVLVRAGRGAGPLSLVQATLVARELSVPLESLAVVQAPTAIPLKFRASPSGSLCVSCGKPRVSRKIGKCRSCELTSPERQARAKATRRKTLAKILDRLRAGAKFDDVKKGNVSRAGGWKRYNDENPDIAAEIDAIRRDRMRPVHRDTIPEGCYLIQCETTGLVKIGYSNDPNDRLRTLRTGSPTRLKIRGVLGGGRDMEATLHARFAHRRSHGEWYALTDDELAETLCGSVVPEPGSYRSAKRAQARLAALAPRPVQERAKAERAKAYACRPLAPMRHDAHIKSWVQAEAFRVYTQNEISWLTGWTQASVSRALSEVGVVAVRRYRVDRTAFLAEMFSA